ESMPKLPLASFNTFDSFLDFKLSFPEIPVLFGKPNIDRLNNEKILCGLDLFGSMFFMLSRYEEMVVKERDQHDRFSAKSSVAFKGEFLMRPIVNEYLEILWQLLSYLDNSLIRRERTFKTILTCDVDWPF